MDLITVPVKAELTEIESFLIDNVLDYGIIAGGFAAYLYNPEKKADDIDLFVNEYANNGAFDRLYHELGAKMNFWKKLKWRMEAEHPKVSLYNANVSVQGLNIWDYTKKGTPGHHSMLQVVTHSNENDTRHSTVESILETFDWNVCKASVLNKTTLLVDRQFIENMDGNVVTFRPYPLRKTTTKGDYGWRMFKYIELKGYDMPFKDMLTIFALLPDKKVFYDQVFRSGHKIQNTNLVALGNYINLMMQNDPSWNDDGSF